MQNYAIKSNKKMVACLLIFIILLLMIQLFAPLNIANAETNFLVSASEATASVGKSTDIAVNLSDNKGVWGMKIEISYDKDSFTLENCTIGDVFDKSEVTPSSNTNEGKYVFFADRNDFKNTIKNGNLVTLSFKVNATAQAKEYPITVKAIDVIDVDGNAVNIASNDGKITVSNCMHESDEWVKSVESTCKNEGKENKVCKICGVVLESRTVEKLEHSFTKKGISNETKRSEATKTEKATYFYTCEKCGEISQTLHFENGEINVDAPNTGNDKSFIFIILLVISILTLGTICFFSFKKFTLRHNK